MRRARLFVGLSLLGAPICVGYAAIYWFALGSVAGTLTFLAEAVGFLLLPLLLVRIRDTETLNFIGGLAVFAMLVGIDWFRGGANPAILAWDVILPVGAILAKQRTVALWTILAGLHWAVSYTAHIFGVTPSMEWANPTVLHMLDISSMAGILAVLCGMAVLYTRGLVQSHDEIAALAQGVREERSQRLESLGLLAGGVAHDFNNLLAVLISHAELARQELGKDHPNVEDLDIILKAAHQGAGITKQLLAFGKPVSTKATYDLHASVERLVQLAASTIGKKIRLECTAPKNLWHAIGHEQRIERVLMNLGVNARDAMPNGGTLCFILSNVELVHDGVLPPGHYVQLLVTDTGCGMPPEVLARAFDPFFSTKTPDKGTGLGLATCQSIVHTEGGHLSVSSEVGVGTSFRILLPADPIAVPRKDRTRVTLSRSIPAAERETRNILLVEDDPAVRQGVERLLRQLGFTVQTADNGEAALHTLLANPQLVDVVLTDVSMPRLNGPGFVKAMRAQGLFPPVVYMSGNANAELDIAQAAAAGDGFLAKPFSLRELHRALDDALDEDQLRATPPVDLKL